MAKAKTPLQEARAWANIKKALSKSSKKLMKILLGRPVRYLRNVNLRRFIQKKDAEGNKFKPNQPFTVRYKERRGRFAGRGELSRSAVVKQANERLTGPLLKKAAEQAMQIAPKRVTVGWFKGKLRRAMYAARMIRFYRWGAILGEHLPEYADKFSEGWKQKFTEKQAWWFLFAMQGKTDQKAKPRGKKKKPGPVPAIIRTLMAKMRKSPPRRILQADDKDQRMTADLFLEGVLDVIEKDGKLSAAGARRILTGQT